MMFIHYRVVEKVVRERFAKAISRGMQGLKINRATNSPINGLIENAVIEVSIFDVSVRSTF